MHVGSDNAEREGTTITFRKYWQLPRTLKQTLVEQIIMSGILPLMGSRGQGNCHMMATNPLVQQLCREEEVEFVGRADMYMRDGLHSTSIGYGAAVFGDELSAAVDSGMGSIQSTVA